MDFRTELSGLFGLDAEFVDQRHDRPMRVSPSRRRRGGAFNFRSVPPNRASRRALSRSTSAFKASRTSEDFSLMPVKA
jgi:hypothetical protein